MQRSRSIPILIAQWAWLLLPIALVGVALPLRIGEVALATVALGLAIGLRARGYTGASRLIGLYMLFLLIFSILGRWGPPLPLISKDWAVYSYYIHRALVVLFSIAVTLPWLSRGMLRVQWKKQGPHWAVIGCLWVILLLASWLVPHGIDRASGTVLFWLLTGLWIVNITPFVHIFNQPRFLRIFALGLLGLVGWTGIYSIAGYFHLQRGMEAENHGQYHAALSHYRASTVCFDWTGWNSAAAQTAIHSAQLSHLQQGPSTALQALAQARRFDPRLAKSLVLQAEILIQLDKPKEAWSELNKLGPTATISPETRRRLLSVYLRLKAWEEAAHLIARAPELLQELHTPSIQPDSLEAVADALWALAKKEQALQLFQALLIQPDPATNIYGKIGQLQFEMGMLEDSRVTFQLLDKILPGNPTASHFLGLFSEKEHRYEDALTHYLGALQSNPDQGPSLERITALLNRWPDKSALQSRLKRHLQGLIPAHSVKVTWDNWLLFLGYDLDSRKYKRGEEFTVTHYWQILRPQRTPPIWFLHLDKPYESLHPPSKYRLAEDLFNHYGTILKVAHKLLIPESLSPGLYRLVLGAYRPRYGNYYNLKPVILKNAALHRLPENAIHLTKLQVQ